MSRRSRHPRSILQNVLVVLFVDACTTPVVPRDATNDLPRDDTAIVDDTGPCPATVPPLASGCRVDGVTCGYERQRCRCRGTQWYCEPIECPATPATSGESCVQAGLRCNPSFENECLCVGPELIWNCCNYGVVCGPFREGDRCCNPYGDRFPCAVVDGGVSLTYWCAEGHWRSPVTSIDAGADGSPGDDAGSDIGAPLAE